MTTKPSSQPNHFHLKGHEVDITYSTTSITGAPVIGGQIAGHDVLGLKGTEELSLGTLVSVGVFPGVDRGGTARSFSFLVPRFRDGGDDAQKFHTVGLLVADHQGSVGASPGEALTSYKAVEL